MRRLHTSMRRFAETETRNEGQVWASKFVGRPSLFIGEIMGPDWYTDDWAAWRSFVKTMFGEDQTAAELGIFRKCTGLDEPPGKLQREAWLPVGRRGGKSRILALIAVYLACCLQWSKYLAPGERGFISVLAAQRKQAAQIMGYVKGTITGNPALKSMLVGSPLVESVEIVGSMVIEVVTATITAVRSRTVVAALCDEIAFWQSDESSANPDEEILNAIRPAMLTIPTSILLGASSRYARRGALWNNYRDHYGKSDGPLVWSADTVTMHPSVDPDFIAKEYERDPIAAAAEYGLEFRSDVAAFVVREVVEELVTRGTFERGYIPGMRYAGFCDPSGGSGGDSMTLGISHRDPKTGKGVLDVLREVRPPFNPESVAEEFATTLLSYKVARVKGDHYGGEWPRVQFRKNGVDYDVSDETKSEIYQAWLPLLNSGRVELLDVPRLVMQACGLERRTSRVGKDTIDHAPGGHDDVVNVAAGSLVMVAGVAAPIVIPQDVLARARMQKMR
jgi:hypothetical protein